jgi:hypothetical protein
VCCFVLFFVAASASYGGFYQKSHIFEALESASSERNGIEQMLDGTANRPYVYRQLLPSTANWIDRIVPRLIENWFYIHQGSGPDAYIAVMSDSPIATNKVYFFRYLTVYVATFLFTLLAVYAMYLVCRALEIPPPAAVFAPVVVILLVPYIMDGGGYFYDYPELAFMALAVWVALKFDWWWVIPVAALGTWNKESFLLFIPTLYPIFRRQHSRLGALLGVGVLCLICAAVYFPERLQFAHNPGSTVEWGLPNQLESFLHPRNLLLATEETYGVRTLKALSVVPIALLVWTVRRGWRHLPRAIQQHGQIAAVINITLYLLFCCPGELRDLSMLYIIFLLVLAVNLNDWVGGSERRQTMQTG